MLDCPAKSAACDERQKTTAQLHSRQMAAALARLQNDVGLDHLIAPKRWWRFGSDSRDFIGQIVQRTAWVEHYPRGAGLAPDGSFALVNMERKNLVAYSPQLLHILNTQLPHHVITENGLVGGSKDGHQAEASVQQLIVKLITQG